MKSAAFIAVALAALAQAQTRADIPSCALPCLDDAVKASTSFIPTTSASARTLLTLSGPPLPHKVLPATQALCAAAAAGGSGSSGSSAAAGTTAAPHTSSAAETSAAETSAVETSAAPTTAAHTSAHVSSAPISTGATSILTTSTPAGTGVVPLPPTEPPPAPRLPPPTPVLPSCPASPCSLSAPLPWRTRDGQVRDDLGCAAKANGLWLS
ncbi:extracellular membrane [Trichoderma cornu-damae]|uniref:Extracellular membrane n=1 Tax=Trichoderma cornu-damae TaxID=654480 RepID=A0A9P8TTG7_9HYPO|nr:extracellular membrane [Trichoderma cornu-damae]